MAEARKITRKEKKLVEVDVPTGEIDLRLTRSEARVLMTILRCVGGNAYSSARQHQESVLYALQEAGIPNKEHCAISNVQRGVFIESNLWPEPHQEIPF